MKSESPDFILKVSTKTTIGIEVTRLRPPVSLHQEYKAGDIALSKEILEQTVAGKEEKLPIYRQKRPDRIWLIISCENIEERTGYNLANKIQNWSIKTGFHRIFLFDTAKPKIYEVSIA